MISKGELAVIMDKAVACPVQHIALEARRQFAEVTSDLVYEVSAMMEQVAQLREDVDDLKTDKIGRRDWLLERNDEVRRLKAEIARLLVEKTALLEQQHKAELREKERQRAETIANGGGE